MANRKFNRMIAFSLAACLSFLLGGCAQSVPTTTTTTATIATEPTGTLETTVITTTPTEEIIVDKKIKISPSNASTMNGGKFEGWGTSLCWWANRVGYSDKLSQLAADVFFGENGLHLNIMRYNIGGGDDPSHDHITRTDSAIPGWLVWDKDANAFVYDYEADKNQLNVLSRCVEAAGDTAIVEVFSNSPPYFMTVSGCSSGGESPDTTNIKDDSYGAFAEYLAHVTDYIQNKMGIPVTSLSPMNEPHTDFWRAGSSKQEGCHVDMGEDQSRVIVQTAEAMKNYDLSNVIIAASDETSTARQIMEYKTYSPAAKKVIGRINTHTYDSSRILELGQLAKDEGFHMWMSEVDNSGTAGENAGEMGSALWLGEKIISDINALSSSAWVIWQVIDTHISADGYNGRKDSGMVDVNRGFWGTAVADHDKEEIILTQKYYAFGQFSRYIRPGSTLIHSNGDTLAAIDNESGELVIVVLNRQAENKTVQFDLSQFAAVGDIVKAVRTSGGMENGEHWAELEDINTDGKGFIAELKGNSITTFIIGGSQA